jgi:hypothetical protein
MVRKVVSAEVGYVKGMGAQDCKCSGEGSIIR